LRDPSQSRERWTPEVVGGIDDAAGIVLGDTTACARLTSGRVLCWGQRVLGEDRHVPVPIPGLSDVVSLSAGGTTVCAVTTERRAHCWGQLGLGPGRSRHEQPSTLPVADVVEAEAMSAGACLRHGDGRVSCLGRGALWLDGGESRDLVPAPDIADAISLTRIAGSTMCASTRSGDVKCWGNNRSGELALGSQTQDFSAPVPIPALRGMTLALGASSDACGERDGALWCWGENRGGMLASARGVLTAPVRVLPLRQ